jgi:uncharacterized protein (DUF1778 family)
MEIGACLGDGPRFEEAAMTAQVQTRSKPRSVHPKSERVDVRMTPEIKELLQRAAAIRGRSLSDFVVESAQEAAVAAIRDEHVMKLTAEDSRVLAEALLNPPEPNEALIRALRRHRELVGQVDA